MPEPPSSPAPGDPNSQLLLQTLYAEQARLRVELERLRAEQERLQEQVKSSEKQDKEGEQKQEDGDKQEGDQDQDKDKKDQKEKDGEGKQDDKKKDKEPAKEKAKHWTRAHPIATVLIIVGFVILLVAGYFVWQYIESYESTDDAQVDGHTDSISARISGFVIGAYVEDTYYVKKGQVLVDLDPRDYLVALEQARANLAQAEASVRAQTPNVPITTTTQSTAVATSQLAVDSATANVAAAEQSYRSALADLTQAEANAANATAEEERYRQLVVKQEISREIYDERATQARAQAAVVQSRRATADAALKNITQAQAALDQARQRAQEAANNLPREIAIQHATLKTREANVVSAQAQVDQALLNLKYCKILAPADGIVGDKSVQAGTQVSAGQEMLAITQTNDIWVTANFKETEIRNMHAGQSVTIHVDALSQDFNGYVEALPGGTGAIYSLLPPENATGNYVKVVQRLPVRIRFKKGQPYEERLRPGMSVEPKVWIK